MQLCLPHFLLLLFNKILSQTSNYSWTWSPGRKRFSIHKRSPFFLIKVLRQKEKERKTERQRERKSVEVSWQWNDRHLCSLLLSVPDFFLFSLLTLKGKVKNINPVVWLKVRQSRSEGCLAVFIPGLPLFSPFFASKISTDREVFPLLFSFKNNGCGFLSFSLSLFAPWFLKREERGSLRVDVSSMTMIPTDIKIMVLWFYGANWQSTEKLQFPVFFEMLTLVLHTLFPLVSLKI